MTISAFAFYVFALAAVASGLMVVCIQKSGTFCTVSDQRVHFRRWIVRSHGAEYLAMVLIVVYVGAVAVLFMFVVMMLDVDFVEMKQGFLQYLPIGGALAAIVVFELLLVVAVWAFPSDTELALAHPSPNAAQTVADPNGPNNIEAIGLILYTDYVHYFQIAGIVLLIAMIGAIILTFRTRDGIKKQDAAAQIGRKREDGYELVDIKPGQGLS